MTLLTARPLSLSVVNEHAAAQPTTGPAWRRRGVRLRVLISCQDNRTLISNPSWYHVFIQNAQRRREIVTR